MKGLLGLKENGIFQKGIFQEAVLEADRQAIIAYYQDRGYVDVAINDVVREVYYNQEKDQDELTLIFDITEGISTISSGNKSYSCK